MAPALRSDCAGINSRNPVIVDMTIRALGELASHVAHGLPSTHGPLPARSFPQVVGLKGFLIGHWREQHRKSGHNMLAATIRDLGLTDGARLNNLTRDDLGLERNLNEVSPEELVEALRERISPWGMIPQILCTFWSGDPEVHELVWDIQTTDSSPHVSLTTLGLLNVGRFATPEATAFRISQLSRLGGEPAALGAVILAAQGLAISRSLDGLPHLITAAEQHPGATTDILVAVAAYDDAQLASYARELQSLVDTSRSTRPMGAASAALDRLQSFADRAEP